MEDLTAKTPGFWERYIMPKLGTELLGLRRYVSEPYPDGPNEYMTRIEANMDRIRSRPGKERAAGTR